MKYIKKLSIISILKYVSCALSLGIILYTLSAYTLHLLTPSGIVFYPNLFDTQYLQTLVLSAFLLALIGWSISLMQNNLKITYPFLCLWEENVVYIVTAVLFAVFYKNIFLLRGYTLNIFFVILFVFFYLTIPQLVNFYVRALDHLYPFVNFYVDVFKRLYRKYVYPKIAILIFSFVLLKEKQIHKKKILSISLGTILYLLIIIGVLIVASYIPIAKTYGKLRIGGDTILPLIPEFSYQMIYQWIPTSNGQYASTDFTFWIATIDFFKKLGLTIYQAGFFYQLSIFFLSGLGLYKIFTLFNKQNRFVGLIPAIYFLYSPYHFDHMVFFTATPVAIWFTYVLMKFIKSKKLTLIDTVIISFATGFIGNLPNPKYHFLIVLIYIVGIIAALTLKLLTLRDIKANTKYFLLIVLMTTYLSLPFLYFGKSFASDQGLMIKTTQEGGAEQHALDYGAAFISKMVKLWHTPSMDYHVVDFMNTPLWGINYYIIPLLVLGLFPLLLRTFDKNRQKIYLIFYVLALFFVFLSKSSNPPLGYFYDWLVLSAKVFAFMRTSAGMVIFAAIFYALLYGIIVHYFIQKYPKLSILLLLASLILILIPGYHIWSGEYFRNYSPVNPHINKKEYGLTIPKEYFESAYILNRYQLDSKIDIFPSFNGYLGTKWGYFGFGIYQWLYDKATISFDKSNPDGFARSQTNTKFMINEKSIDNEAIYDQSKENPIYQSKILDVYKLPNSKFLPHFYIPSHILFSTNAAESLSHKEYPETYGIYYKDRSNAVFNSLPKNISDKPIIEYKKIDPTKYRLRIHNAKNVVPLIFLDNYHTDWNLYFNSSNYPKINFNASDYTSFRHNEDEQIGLDELRQDILNGWISSLGDLTEKTDTYYRYVNQQKIFDYTLSYKIDFISKNFSGTIQNDNLPNRSVFETWLKKPLEANHMIANNYANSWILNPSQICKINNCTKNIDGTYDFELVAEFWPQRLSTLGYLLSFIPMLLIIAGVSTRLIIKKL